MTKIQLLRNEKQMNRKELSQKAGLSDGVIHRIEKGKTKYSNITIGSFYKIAKALDVDLMDVIDLELLEDEKE